MTRGWSNQQHGIKVTGQLVVLLLGTRTVCSCLLSATARMSSSLVFDLFSFLISHSASGAFGWAFWSTAVYIGKLFLFIFYSFPGCGMVTQDVF